MDELGLAEGDVIDIAGKQLTAARAIRPYGEDERPRHHPPRRPAARQCRGRLGRFRRDPSQSRIRSRPRGSCSPRPRPMSGCRVDEALKRTFARPADDRRRYGRHRRPPARQCRCTGPHTPTANAPAFALAGVRLTVVDATSPKASSTSTATRRSSCCRSITERPANAEPTSPTTISAACATPSTRSARWSSCRCATRSCSSGSASIRPRACCCTVRQAPARPCSRAPSPMRATRNSSTSPARRSWARLWRERGQPARDFRGGGQGGAVHHLHRRDRLDRAQTRAR